MCDYQMSHGRGILLSPKLNFDCEQYARPVRRHYASKRKKESNKSIQNKMSKMYAECSQNKKACELFAQDS